MQTNSGARYLTENILSRGDHIEIQDGGHKLGPMYLYKVNITFLIPYFVTFLEMHSFKNLKKL